MNTATCGGNTTSVGIGKSLAALFVHMSQHLRRVYGSASSLALAGLLAVTAPSAHALLIDFTDAAMWVGAEGQTEFSQSYGALTVTIRSPQSGRPLAFNSGGPTSPGFLGRDGDGIGVGADGLITKLEPADNDDLIVVTFSLPVRVQAYYFLNFGMGAVPDAAQANFGRVGPNTVFLDMATATDSIGFYGRDDLSVTGFHDISFTSVGPPSSGFTLAAIRLHQIPEPGTLALLSLGVAALAFTRRRKK